MMKRGTITCFSIPALSLPVLGRCSFKCSLWLWVGMMFHGFSVHNILSIFRLNATSESVQNPGSNNFRYFSRTVVHSRSFLSGAGAVKLG